MHKHPQIAELHKLYLSENQPFRTQPFRKVHRLIDLFESIIKTHTVLIVSEYVQHNKLSEAAKGLLAQGLRTPSLGTWQLFSRVLFSELAREGFKGFFPSFEMDFVLSDNELYSQIANGKIEFPAFDKKQIAELKKQKKKRLFFFDDVIAFRNGIAHGATPNDEDCLEDIIKYEPFLHQLLELQWLKESALLYKNSKVYMTGVDSEICLHPLIIYKDEGDKPPFAFFNDLKNDKIGLLNYPLSKHYREKDFWNEFHQYLPLHEWKKSGNNEFYQRIEELTETFKGRQMEREELLNFVLTKNKGYFSVLGNPGIGKSALIAQFFKDLKAKEETKDIQVIEYFIRRVSDNSTRGITLLSYLNRKTDEVFKEAKEIFADSNDIWDVQAQLFKKWHLYGEKATNPKLVILIDGIDEAAEKDLISFIPKENFNNILFIYGSRPDGHPNLTDLWTRLPVENHKKLLLGGLSKEDIRALIYEVSNKYEIEKDSLWIDLVLKKSEGNPLYLKLLCDGLSNGDLKLNDTNALPKEIFGFYKGILDRYARNPNGAALLNGLYTFAAAKDYITEGHLKHINKLEEDQVHQVLSTLKEVLCENPLTENVLDYQLFHESLRVYLMEVKELAVIEAGERIIGFCVDWKKYQGSWEQRYALEYYASHLSESKKEARILELLALLKNEFYIQTQKKVLKQFDATSKLYQLSLQKATDQKDYDSQLEAALSLVDLKYEEANDAPQIVAMVAAGDTDLALKRIDRFAGNDKEGLQRKFTLYMLCLMELTLLDSKDKPHRKNSIEKLLNHLDEKIPVDHSILKWNDFFPSYLMFKMACVWAELGLDYGVVYKRTDDWDSEWIGEMGPYGDLQFEVLMEVVFYISDKGLKIHALLYISRELAKQGNLEKASFIIKEAFEFVLTLGERKNMFQMEISMELAKQGKVEEAIGYAQGISSNYWKSSAFSAISTEIAKQGEVEKATEYVHVISENVQKSRALKNISAQLFRQGNLKKSASFMQEALLYTRGISNEDYEKSLVLKDISIEIAHQGFYEEAIDCLRGIFYENYKVEALKSISIELAKQEKFIDALEYTRSISIETEKVIALKEISFELYKKGKYEEAASVIQEALSCARSICDKNWKSSTLFVISTELSNQGKNSEAASVIQEALDCALGISNKILFGWALRDINSKLIVQEKVKEIVYIFIETLDCLPDIIDDNKLDLLRFISKELARIGRIEEAASVLLEAKNKCNEYEKSEYEKSRLLRHISIDLVEQGKIEESLACARGISNDFEKSRFFRDLSIELAIKGQIYEALDYIKGINENYDKSIALMEISRELTKQGSNNESASAMREALEYTRVIFSSSDKIRSFCYVSGELFKQGKIEKATSLIEEAIEFAFIESDQYYKIRAILDISGELFKQNKYEKATSMMQKAIEYTSVIMDNYDKFDAFKDISIELSKQANYPLSEQTCLEIPQMAKRHDCWKEIAKTLKKEHGWYKSLQLLEEFKSKEARTFYLKGWAESITSEDMSEELIQKALPALAEDRDSIEALLQLHAIHQLFFENPNKERIARYNKTLNIQWALDIKAQFPQDAVLERRSDNLEIWIGEIGDEDDRDDIRSWADKVQSGKMTEEKFREKVRAL